MIITDLPGVGESRDRDAEYEALYRDSLPELDLVLWLIKADDRALFVDEYFWRHILHRGHQQVLFVVTQADKTEPVSYTHLDVYKRQAEYSAPTNTSPLQKIQAGNA